MIAQPLISMSEPHVGTDSVIAGEAIVSNVPEFLDVCRERGKREYSKKG